ncbi:hypothetical protein THH46_04275 [Pseudomonas sp. NA13]
MDVYYVGTDKTKRSTLLASDADVILLLFDRWDDFNFKTTFPTYCRIGGQVVELCPIRILFDGQKVSYSYLDELVANGWNGKFPYRACTTSPHPIRLLFTNRSMGILI